MSILQEYQSIKSRMKNGEFEAIEEYLKTHPERSLSDLYYNEERYKEFYFWWKRKNPPENKQEEIDKVGLIAIDTDANVQVYVDGSYNKENDTTGAGIVIVINDQKLYKKSFIVPTEKGHSWNIDGECHATLEALRICSGKSLIEDTVIIARNITINYDYMGIEKWITREWKIKSKIAKEYSKEFNELVKAHNINVTFNKIKAHSGDKHNEMADGLAREATI